MRWFLGVALLCGTISCSDSIGPDTDVGPLRVQPAATTYPAGATVHLTLTNFSGQRLHYAPCTSQLEQRNDDGEWVVVHEDQAVCAAVLQYLDPWASREVTIPLPAELEPAAHRIRFPSIGVPYEDGFIMATQVGDSFVVQP